MNFVIHFKPFPKKFIKKLLKSFEQLRSRGGGRTQTLVVRPKKEFMCVFPNQFVKNYINHYATGPGGGGWNKSSGLGCHTALVPFSFTSHRFHNFSCSLS